MWSTLLKSSRLPFLVLPPAVIALGYAAARWQGAAAAPVDVLLILLGALAAHASVNLFNEYSDYRSGLDLHTERTPFSGGSGGLLLNPAALGAVLAAAVVTLLLTVAVGLYFVAVRGWQLLPPGLLGVAIILTYTRWLNRSPLLCLIAPGLAFGPLMVLGTEFALTGHYTPATLLLALIPFFLVNNLLLLNQFPDVEADRRAGRYHLLIALGPQRSAMVLLLQAGAAEVLLVGAVGAGVLPVFTLLALLPLSLALLAGVGAWRHGQDIPRLLPFMGINVLAVVTTPGLLALGLLL